MSKISAEPVIVIGASKAAAKLAVPAGGPGLGGDLLLQRGSATAPAVSWVGGPNSGLRSANGSVIDGSVLKNWTPATKSLMASPVSGSSRMPLGQRRR